MKLFAPLAAATTLAAALASQPAVAGSISVEIGQPGVYGRIVLGDDERPVVVYREPVIVVPARYAPVRRPIYLYVPPGHQKNWSRHCSRYQACGQPVYFVQEGWVRERNARHAPALRQPQVQPRRHAQPQHQSQPQRHAQPQRQVRQDDGRGGPGNHRH